MLEPKKTKGNWERREAKNVRALNSKETGKSNE